jgi:hypothetical protein
MDVYCHDGGLFGEARDRLMACRDSIEHESGISMRLFNIESGQEIICSSWEDDSTDELSGDEESDEGSDEGSDAESDEGSDEIIEEESDHDVNQLECASNVE